MPRKLTSTTTDHDEIRRWVEGRGGWPAEVASTERKGEPGILRIDFPGYSGEGSLKKIAWEDWFEKFDRSDLVFLYQETTSDGATSNFNKLVHRETAEERVQEGRRSPRGSRSGTRKVAGSGTRKMAQSGSRKAAHASAARTATRKRR